MYLDYVKPIDITRAKVIQTKLEAKSMFNSSF